MADDHLPDPGIPGFRCAECWGESGEHLANCSRFYDPAPVSAAVSPPEPPERVYDEIAAERVRQDAKWGGVPGIDRRDDHTYAAVLGEEFGEVCKAWLERDVDGLREELVQTAAVAVAWIAELDNGGRLARGC